MAEEDEGAAQFLEDFALPEEEPQVNLRADLFGEGESDEDEDYAPAPQQEERAVPDRETSPADEEPGASQHFRREPSPEAQARAAEPSPSAAEPDLSQQQGGHEDIFASDSEEEGRRGDVSEAEDEDEEDEFEAMFRTNKKRQKKGQAQEILMTVETLIANMEVAAEMDIAANEEGKPAVNKIKMLPQVEERLSQTLLHRELLDGGILGALKLWIELLPNGSLPNVKVRTAVFKMLHKLPIDLTLEGRKEQLKKSELGKYVMFYSKLPDEVLPNRQLARTLVEKWSRPIFDQYRERGQEEEMQPIRNLFCILESGVQEREVELAKLRKKRRLEADAATASEPPPKNLQPGDPGFRWHARIPAPARLDYLRLPESGDTGDGEAVKGKAKPKDKMSKKLAALSRKGGKKGGEGKVSLQGRGLLM